MDVSAGQSARPRLRAAAVPFAAWLAALLILAAHCAYYWPFLADDALCR